MGHAMRSKYNLSMAAARHNEQDDDNYHCIVDRKAQMVAVERWFGHLYKPRAVAKIINCIQNVRALLKIHRWVNLRLAKLLHRNDALCSVLLYNLGRDSKTNAGRGSHVAQERPMRGANGGRMDNWGRPPMEIVPLAKTAQSYMAS